MSDGLPTSVYLSVGLATGSARSAESPKPQGGLHGVSQMPSWKVLALCCTAVFSRRMHRERERAVVVHWVRHARSSATGFRTDRAAKKRHASFRRIGQGCRPFFLEVIAGLAASTFVQGQYHFECLLCPRDVSLDNVNFVRLGLCMAVPIALSCIMYRCATTQ